MHNDEQEFKKPPIFSGFARDMQAITGNIYALLDVAVLTLATWGYLSALGVPAEQLRMACVLTIIVVPSVFTAGGMYRPWRTESVGRELWRVTVLWTGSSLIMTTAILAIGPQRWLITLVQAVWWAYPLLMLIAVRLPLRLLLHRLRRNGRNLKHIVVIGNGKLLETVVKRVQAASWSGLSLIGYFSESKAAINCSYKGDLSALPEYLANHNIDQVWLAYGIKDSEATLAALQQLKQTAMDVKYIPDLAGFTLFNHSSHRFEGLSVVNLTESPVRGFPGILKALIEGLLALLAICFLAPLMLLIALAIKLTTPGPVIFQQQRHGVDGHPIMVYKFRTMYVDEGQRAFKQAKKADPRITRVGRFLRRTSLDELPQLFNVLTGNMALVGPRPHPVALNEQYREQIQFFMLRHRVRPGITGLAQVNGYRGETETVEEMQRRIEYDLKYINEWSLWLDFQILLSTLVVFLFQKQAH